MIKQKVENIYKRWMGKYFFILFVFLVLQQIEIIINEKIKTYKRTQSLVVEIQNSKPKWLRR